MRKVVRLVVAVALLLVATQAQAAIISFASRAAFDAGVAGIVTEGWDGVAAGTVIPTGTNFAGITHTPSVGDALVTNSFLVTSSPNGLGRTGVGFFLDTDTMAFGFGGPIYAFGIDINTFSTANGSYTATTSNGDVVTSFFDPFPGTNTGQFVGFISTVPFTSVTIATGPGGLVTLWTRCGIPGRLFRSRWR